jgi:1,4-alpha-glucan branching enzyme
MNEPNKTLSQPQNIATSQPGRPMSAAPKPAAAKPVAATPTAPATPTSASTSSVKVSAQTATPETKPQPTQSKAAQGTVRFEVEAPKASAVFVAGTFNGWKPGATPLSGVGAGKWAKELSLAPGRYEYRFVVDGQWIDDPQAKTFAPNPHGGRNAVLEVGQARN